MGAQITFGSRFDYDGIVDRLPAGGYVRLRGNRSDLLGQIYKCRKMRDDPHRYAGYGRVLAELVGKDLQEFPRVFQHLADYEDLAPADSLLISRYFAWRRQGEAPSIGWVICSSDAEESRARAFVRVTGDLDHTFVCGQSGSGKSFALGTLLERHLLYGEEKMIILDFNSDYVNLDRAMAVIPAANRPRLFDRATCAKALRRFRLIKDSICIISPRRRTGLSKIRPSDLAPEHLAALINLNSASNPSEFSEFATALSDLGKPKYSWPDIVRRVDDSTDDGALASRLDASGVIDWSIWCARGERSLTDLIRDPAIECLVIDLEQFDEEERATLALAVLHCIWTRRAQRDKTLIVVDEAHNLCQRGPTGRLLTHLARNLRRIAAEGRKYRIRMMIATQKPQKIHPEVAEECRSVLLMRLGASSDLKHLIDGFRGAPEELIRLAPDLEKGEAIIWGALVPSPTLLKIDGRLLGEGRSLKRTGK